MDLTIVGYNEPFELPPLIHVSADLKPTNCHKDLDNAIGFYLFFVPVHDLNDTDQIEQSNKYSSTNCYLKWDEVTQTATFYVDTEDYWLCGDLQDENPLDYPQLAPLAHYDQIIKLTNDLYLKDKDYYDAIIKS